MKQTHQGTILKSKWNFKAPFVCSVNHLFSFERTISKIKTQNIFFYSYTFIHQQLETVFLHIFSLRINKQATLVSLQQCSVTAPVPWDWDSVCPRHSHCGLSFPQTKTCTSKKDVKYPAYNLQHHPSSVPTHRNQWGCAFIHESSVQSSGRGINKR